MTVLPGMSVCSEDNKEQESFPTSETEGLIKAIMSLMYILSPRSAAFEQMSSLRADMS